jgi:hypothetical protein
VAWFPLGPREVFVPAYHVSPVYVSRVNVTTVTNVTVVNRVYVNQTVGVTAVDHRAFVASQPVQRTMVNVPRDAVARGEIMHTAAVVPERSSVMAHPGASVNVPHPADRVMARPVYAQRTPAPAAVTFAARQQALQANPGRPVDARTISQLRTTAPVREPAVRTLPPPPSITRPAVATQVRDHQPVEPAVTTPPTPNPMNQQRERTQVTPGQPVVTAPGAPRPEVQPKPAAREEKPAAKKDNKKKKEEKKEEK